MKRFINCKQLSSYDVILSIGHFEIKFRKSKHQCGNIQQGMSYRHFLCVKRQSLCINSLKKLKQEKLLPSKIKLDA